MNYNPYSKEYNSLKQLLEDKTLEKKELLEELNWFITVDIGNLYFLLKAKEEEKSDTQIITTNIATEIDALKSKIYYHKKEIKTLFNPFNWFNDNQKFRRRKLSELEKELNTKLKNKTGRERELSEIDKLINQYKNDIDKYTHFDRENSNKKLNELNYKLVSLEEKVKSIYELKVNVDIKLEPILSQIEELESNISRIKEKKIRAQSFENDLAEAENSYEKAKIHGKCESDLGDGSPKKIIIESERTLTRLERDLDKAKKRASIISEKAIREIHKIIIDGNNLCYEGNEFVGLKPLIKLTSKLDKIYQIIVIFDSAIRNILKTSDENINNQFNENIKTHIVATKQLADETILDIASEDTFCYIISNDRFGEYKDKEAVKNNRIIRHEIIDGNILIHDLNINEKYC
jgi:chromosome segregation ATPase